jgi:hypothetical protein
MRKCVKYKIQKEKRYQKIDKKKGLYIFIQIFFILCKRALNEIPITFIFIFIIS